MLNRFKKKIAFLMATVLMFTMCNFSMAFANESYSFMGKDEILLDYSEGTVTTEYGVIPEFVMSYIENSTGEYTIYTYDKGELVEIVECGWGWDNIITKTVDDGKVVDVETIDFNHTTQETPTPYAYEYYGWMDNTSSFTGETLRVTVYLNQSSVVHKCEIQSGSYSVAQIAGILISAFVLPSLKVATNIVEIIFGSWIIGEVVKVATTKTVTGTETTYDWKGLPSNAVKGQVGYLEGRQIKYSDVDGKAHVYKEVYTPSDWKTDTFGRMMFYEVYGLDVQPTKWYTA